MRGLIVAILGLISCGVMACKEQPGASQPAAPPKEHKTTGSLLQSGRARRIRITNKAW